MDGTMKPEVRDFAGMEVKPRSDDDKVRLGTDIAVLKYLQEHGTLFSKENITHSYPHCWRCDTPLLNYATSSWFVSVTKIKDNLLQNAKAINWSPEHIKEGRWGNWLEGARDWSISRQRFWASVIPIWKCEACKKIKVFGNAAELEKASGKKVNDLHKHIVDEITVPCECGTAMRRIPDVLDTWFDSGSMPYGERHYPFENKEKFDKAFPAQFIAEGLDQTRAWFYYLHVLAGALFKKSAFQNVIVNGIVLAEDGKKMSKKLQNYPDPMEVVEKYGADALRFYLLSSPVMQAENLSFAEKGVDEVARKNIGRLGNVLSFYQLYADGTARGTESVHVLDRWILARLNELVRESTEGYEKYQLDTATRPIAGFIDDLSVWYLRRSRERFKEGGADAKAALATLRHILYTLSTVMAPAMPFFAEHLYQAVKEGNDPESVHLMEWPTQGLIDDGLLFAMEEARSIASQALERRSHEDIKVRQPLSTLRVNHHLPGSVSDASLLEEIIKDEVNVKKIEWSADIPFTVELDTTLTRELHEEGFVRDLVRAIQDKRKDAGLVPNDTIKLEFGVDKPTQELIQKNLKDLKHVTRAVSVKFKKLDETATMIGSYPMTISIQKV